MNALDPALFKACFTAWVEGFRETEPDIIAIDGKTSRRSLAHSRRHEPLWLAPTNGTRVYVSLRLQGRPDPATGALRLEAGDPLVDGLPRFSWKAVMDQGGAGFEADPLRRDPVRSGR